MVGRRRDALELPDRCVRSHRWRTEPLADDRHQALGREIARHGRAQSHRADHVGQGARRHADELVRPHAHQRSRRGQAHDLRRHHRIRATDFGITKRQQDQLYENGRVAATTWLARQKAAAEKAAAEAAAEGVASRRRSRPRLDRQPALAARLGPLGDPGPAESHHAVGDRRLLEHLLVAAVVLRVDPRLAVALLREQVHHPLHVARREVLDPGTLGHVGVGGAQARRALHGAGLVHVVEQAAHVLADQVGAQRPRRVDVPERRRQVRHVGVGEPLVGPRLREVDRLTVDHEVHLAERHQLQAGGGDDDVGLEFVAGRAA